MLVAAVVVAGPTSVLAQPAKKPTHKPIDMKPLLADLLVFKDDVGKYYVAPRIGIAPPKDTSQLVFYGDGKHFYLQGVVAYSAQTNPTTFEWVVWSPRVRGRQHALLAQTPTELYVACGPKDKDKRPLTQLSADQARKLLGKAKFFEQYWQRSSRFLARDDDGTYYFVDQLRDEAGGGGFRIFVGKKGAMKEQTMTNIVSDSAGDIFATKAGELKFITEGGKAFWKKGSKKTELTVLPPLDNRYLIYRELGIYGVLGTVCEDQ